MNKEGSNRQPLVLIVDDDMSLRLLACEALEQAGFAVEETDNGRTALVTFQRLRPDLVILDVMMPEMDGYQVCAALRELPGGRHISVLMMTGLKDIDSINRAYEVGATDFVTKPINYILLGHRLRYMLRSQRSEERLRLAQKLEAVGQLAAGIAHEINTPIQYVGDNVRFLKTAIEDLQTLVDKYRESFSVMSVPETILGQLKEAEELADLPYLSEQVPDAFASTLEGIERVAQIVRAMKQFAHPGMTDKDLADLNAAIESTATVTRNEWKYVANLDLKLDPDLPPVPCLIGDINQVVLKMIINAAHAIQEKLGEAPAEKGTITITTHAENAEAVIRIHDTGAGIPEHLQSRIFDLFFTTKEVGKGSGQGLAISHSVVHEKHGGYITCESSVGIGTTFGIHLPLNETGTINE